MLRTPVLSPAAFNEATIKAKLNTDYVKAAIFMASISLWEEIEKLNWDWDALNEKQKFTIYKYWNRMCFRPTPFGLFSAIHAAVWQNDTDSQTVLPSSLNNDVLLLPDFKLLTYLASNVPVSKSTDLQYYLNKSIYKAGNDYRYIFKPKLPSQDSAEVLSIESNDFIVDLLAFCQTGRTAPELITFFNTYTPDAADMLDALTGQQILYTELDANISGRFFGDRLKNYDNTSLNYILSLFGPTGYQPVNSIAGRITALPPQNELRELSFFKHYFYAISKSGQEVGISADTQLPLLDAFDALNKLNVLPEMQALNVFKEKFKNLYDQKSVQLLLALDPEYGLGYSNLDANIDESELTESLAFDRPPEQSVLKWTNVHRLLVNRLAQAKQVIRLVEDDMRSIVSQPGLIPPAVQMVFRKVDDNIVVEEAGGCNGFYLYSRFTVHNPELLAHCQILAQTEQELNPGVAFAEVSFIPDEHAVNINVRASFYDYEIPVLVHSARDQEQVLDLNDLYVSVSGNEVILRSKRLNKRVIPRFNTAYNFNRSTNAVIRFLGDLQFQDMRANLTFNFQQLIPGLNFYPRVVYKQAILSPAQWIITDADKAVLGRDTDSMLKKLNELNVPEVFAVTEHDNHLVFDQQKATDMALFLNVCRQSKKVTLKEALLANKPATVNENGEEVVNQFVVTLVNQQKVYHTSLQPLFEPLLADMQRTFNLGGEWFYIKLYSHRNVASEFLTHGLSPIINKLIKQKVAKQWFFIRYKDPDTHLRIRIRSNQTDKILAEFNEWISANGFEDKFRRISLEPYTRELERYGFIDEAEASFQASSALILKYLKAKKANKTKLTELQFAVITCTALLKSMGVNDEDGAMFLNNLALYFLNEAGFTRNVKLQIDKKYRTEKPNIEAAFNISTVYLQKELAELDKTIAAYFSKLKNAGCKNLEEYYSNILHMHFNRFFADDQRKKEGVIYYLLAKYQLSLIARQKAATQYPARVDSF
jgi:thiopeptide-type bacteriocin biosynthesis protein